VFGGGPVELLDDQDVRLPWRGAACGLRVHGRRGLSGVRRGIPAALDWLTTSECVK
jgi:hypothetical protein